MLLSNDPSKDFQPFVQCRCRSTSKVDVCREPGTLLRTLNMFDPCPTSARQCIQSIHYSRLVAKIGALGRTIPRRGGQRWFHLKAQGIEPEPGFVGSIGLLLQIQTWWHGFKHNQLVHFDHALGLVGVTLPVHAIFASGKCSKGTSVEAQVRRYTGEIIRMPSNGSSRRIP